MTVTPVRRSPLTFFVLVYALAVPLWVLGAVVNEDLPLPINLPLSALQAFCPLAAALILVYREERSPGVRALLRRVIDVRHITSKVWIVPLLVLVPAIYVFSYWAMRLTGRPLPEPHIPLLAIPVLLLVFLVAAIAEQVGWTGYATEPLLRRWSALTTAVVIGSVWGLLHVIPDIQGHRSLEWIVWQRAVYDVALRVVITWLFINTGYSVFATILVHATDNVSVSLFPTGGSHYDPAFTGATTAIIAVAITFLWGAKTLNHFRYGRRSRTARGGAGGSGQATIGG